MTSFPRKCNVNIFNHSNPIKINLLCLFWYYQQTLTPTMYSLEASLFKKIHCFSHTNISLLCKYLKNRQFSYTKNIHIHTHSHNKNTIFTSFSLDVVLNFVMYKISLSEDTLRRKKKTKTGKKIKSTNKFSYRKNKSLSYKEASCVYVPKYFSQSISPISEKFTLHFKTFEFVVQHFLHSFFFIFCLSF